MKTETMNLLGYKINPANIKNEKVRRVIRDRIQSACWISRDDHTDHNEKHSEKYSDNHTDHTEKYSEEYQLNWSDKLTSGFDERQ